MRRSTRISAGERRPGMSETTIGTSPAPASDAGNVKSIIVPAGHIWVSSDRGSGDVSGSHSDRHLAASVTLRVPVRLSLQDGWDQCSRTIQRHHTEWFKHAGKCGRICDVANQCSAAIPHRGRKNIGLGSDNLQLAANHRSIVVDHDTLPEQLLHPGLSAPQSRFRSASYRQSTTRRRRRPLKPKHHSTLLVAQDCE